MQDMWGRGAVHTGFCGGKLRERDHLEDTILDGKILLNGSSIRGWGMDWIDLAPDRDSWQVVVNAVMKLQIL